MVRDFFKLPRPKIDPLFGKSLGKGRKPINKGIKKQVLERSGGRCERCRKDVIGLGLKPRFHHKDCKPSHNTVSNIVLLCNDCHDKVHVYRTKKEYNPIYGEIKKKVLIAKRIKKRGRKKKVKRKRSAKYETYTNPITGQKEKIKKDSWGLGF